MKISSKTLGIMGMVGAPGLFLEMCNGAKFGSEGSAADGLFDLLYMAGWLCSTFGLIRLKATGEGKHGKRLLRLNVIFLGFACVWNIWEAIDPTNQTLLYRILDCFWPASNLLLLITGIVIMVKKEIKGFTRYAPFIAGFWLAFAFLFGAFAGRTELSFWVIGGYSVVAWFLLGLAIYKSDADTTAPYASGFLQPDLFLKPANVLH